jgi:hypothetical protein
LIGLALTRLEQYGVSNRLCRAHDHQRRDASAAVEAGSAQFYPSLFKPMSSAFSFGLTRVRSLALFAMLGLLPGCQEALVRPITSSPSAALTQASIVDTVREEQRPIAEILEVLADRQRSDGSLIVGLKEPGAQRGVSLRGRQLPVAARLAAEQRLRSDFPSEVVASGVTRLVPHHDQFGSRTDTLVLPFLVLKGPFDQRRLAALLLSAVVSNVEPNHTLIAASSTPAFAIAHIDAEPLGSAAFAEVRPWGIDSVRAPNVWPTYMGSGVTMLMMDTGFDGWSPTFTSHPDFQFAIGLNNYVQNNPSNPCTTGPQSVCYWEGPYHGSGQVGLVMGTQNGNASVGTAPSPTGGLTMAKVTWDPGDGLPHFSESDMIAAILSLSQQNLSSRAPIAVTALVVNDTATAAWPNLQNAYRTAYYDDHVLWIAGASADVPGLPVSIPGAFDEVVAVGSVDAQNGRLVRGPYSPVDSRLELVALAVP